MVPDSYVPGPTPNLVALAGNLLEYGEIVKSEGECPSYNGCLYDALLYDFTGGVLAEFDADRDETRKQAMSMWNISKDLKKLGKTSLDCLSIYSHRSFTVTERNLFDH